MSELHTRHARELIPLPRSRSGAIPAGDWKSIAIAAYHEQRTHEASDLRAMLVARLEGLIGPRARAARTWVDLAERTAGATIDGVQFRLDGTSLVLLRPCSLCGQGQIASHPLHTRADVGYALAAWQPRHPECHPEDPVGWLDYLEIG